MWLCKLWLENSSERFFGLWSVAVHLYCERKTLLSWSWSILVKDLSSTLCLTASSTNFLIRSLHQLQLTYTVACRLVQVLWRLMHASLYSAAVTSSWCDRSVFYCCRHYSLWWQWWLLLQCFIARLQCNPIVMMSLFLCTHGIEAISCTFFPPLFTHQSTLLSSCHLGQLWLLTNSLRCHVSGI